MFTIEHKEVTTVTTVRNDEPWRGTLTLNKIKPAIRIEYECPLDCLPVTEGWDGLAQVKRIIETRIRAWLKDQTKNPCDGEIRVRRVWTVIL